MIFSASHHYEWLCHTNFSFLTGASHPKDMLRAAIDHGYRRLAITDMDGVYGIARAHRDLQKIKQHQPDLDFELRYGADVHLQADHDQPIVLQDTLALLALTHHGYSQLCDILNTAHHQKKTGAFISIDALMQHPASDVVAIQPMRGLIRHPDKHNTYLQRLTALKAHFQDRLYLAISRHLSPAEDHWIARTLELAHILNIPILISQDVFFHSPDQKPVSDLLTAIRCNRPLTEIPQQLFVNAMRAPLPMPQLQRLYSGIPGYAQALENAHRLDLRFQFDLSQLRYHYPREFIPAGYTPQSYLEHLTWQHAHDSYGDPIPEKVTATLRHELALIRQLDFADYFLTVYDIVNWARQRGILCQGRGSAANSAVCFVLGVTAIDPTYFDLLFERFISAERGDPPDIDVDFEHERREEVIQYIYERYGRDKAAMVCNVICFKSKGALRFAGRALGIPEPALTRAAQILSSRAFRRSAAAETVQLVQDEWQQQALPPVEPHLWALWGKMADAIRGFPRHLGIHSGGFLVSNQPLNRLCPTEPATMPGRSVIVWCKEDIEGLGFFKIDILALGGLSLIQKCFALIRTHYYRELSLDQIPPDDPATYAMIQRADTIGTFQIESRAQISFLPRHLPQHFYDLVVQIAIIRPGPIQGGMVQPYLRRRRGEEAVNFPDPRLKPILERTFGVPIFQEQVMRIAMAMGNFTPGEANELRKNIGAFTLRAEPDHWIDRLQEGMRANGLSHDFIDSIVGHIQGFASYGFPESHAASFAILAYATAYLKCHYPTAFFAALLNAQPMGFYAPDTLIKTAQHLGVQFRPVCILNSDWDHRFEPIADTGDYAIRLGFRLVRGLNKENALRMIGFRNQQPDQPLSILEFFSRSGLNRVNITALAAANALVSLGLNRQAAVWLAEAIPVSDWADPPESPIAFVPETTLESVQLDYASTHTSLGPHPAELLKQHEWTYAPPLSVVKTAQQLAQLSRHHSVVVGFGMITCRQSPPTAKGVVFITTWDETGAVNLVVRPDIYLRFRKEIDDYSFICFEGKLQIEGDARSLLVTRIHAPQRLQADIRYLHTEIVPMPQHEILPARNYM